ncbi:MAG: hypothetical protein FWD18_06795 [Micrococcales bacterium]|nr:hypothetical protein [Micrococcales bacterium]
MTQNKTDLTPLLDLLPETPGEGQPDVARHAVARPLPTAPDEPDATLDTTPDTADDPTPDPATSTLVLDTPATGTTAAERTAAPAAKPADVDAGPSPRHPGWTAHVLGVWVGLLLGTAGAGALLLGQAGIVEAQADGWRGTVETLDIALVAGGTAALVLLGLLASWTAAAPLTAGVVTTLLGGYAFVAPGYFGDHVVALLESPAWRPTLDQMIVSASTGTLLLVGLLLLAAAWSTAAARRAGTRFGAYRERHTPTL